MARMGCTPGLDARRYINYIAAGLSICLALAAFGCAAHALAAFEADLHRVPAPWYQAAFGDMFDTRALKITCAVALAVMLHTVAQLVVQSFAARKRVTYGPSWTVERWDRADRITSLFMPATAIFAILFAIIFPEIVNADVSRISVQTWTCTWKPNSANASSAEPASFATLCHENQFAHYGMIPLLGLQLVMLYVAVISRKQPARQLPRGQGAQRPWPRERDDLGSADSVEMSFDSKKDTWPL